MTQVEVTVQKLMCLRCGHTWVPNSEAAPRVCPLCHSPYWNRPRTLRRAKEMAIGKHRLRRTEKAAPMSMFGVSPDLPKFERDEDEFRG